MTASKYNSLKVRRVDLLEELEERFAYMNKEKEQYDKDMASYQKLYDKYNLDREIWMGKIEPFMLSQIKKQSYVVTRYEYSYKWRSPEKYVASVEITYTMDELKELIPGYPQEIKSQPDTPSFLQERYFGYKGRMPSTYKAVYQAIQLLRLSDDEYVSASMYQSALEVL